MMRSTTLAVVFSVTVGSAACDGARVEPLAQRTGSVEPIKTSRDFHPVVEEWLSCTECSLVSPARLQELGPASFPDLARAFDDQWANRQRARCVQYHTTALQQLKDNPPPLPKIPDDGRDRAPRIAATCAQQVDEYRIRSLLAFRAINTPEARGYLNSLASKLKSAALSDRVRATLDVALKAP